MNKEPLPLAQLARSELEFLRRAIVKRQVAMPLTEAGLGSIGKAKLFSRLGPLAGAEERVALALLDLALAKEEPKGAPPTTLVWTGPDVTPTNARTTTAVLLELFGLATQRVFIAGYEFDHGAVIFAPLHQAMVARNVKVDIYLDVRPLPSPKSDVAAYLAHQTHQFLKLNWPFGDPLPRLYYYAAGCEHGSRCSLHAKCVVVDGKHVLVGSANFTRRGHKRNLEVGVHLQDPAIASALIQQFDQLRERGKLLPLPVAIARVDAPPAAAEEEDGTVDATQSDAAAGGLAMELLVSEAARSLFARLIVRGVPVPAVGEDIEGESGEVIGSPELSWDEARIAVLLPEQEGSRKRLERAGWSCFSVEMRAAEEEALSELVCRRS